MYVTDSYRWIILGVMTLCQLAYAITFQSIPPILGILVTTLGISYAQAGGLMSLFSLPRIFVALPGGMMVDRYGARMVGAASLSAIALGTATLALSHGYWVMALGRLVAGVGVTALLVVTPQVVTSWFHDREMGLSMGIFNTAMPLGTILSLNFVGVIAFQFGWRVPIWSTFSVCIITLFLFLSLHRRRDSEIHLEVEPANLLQLLRKAGWGIWWAGLAWALFNAASISYFTYAPDYFVSQGQDIAKAGFLASCPMWGSLILGPLIGLSIDRIGRKWLFIAVGFVGTTVLYYLMPRFIGHAAMFAISIGILSALVPPALFTLPAELLPQSMIGLGFGVISTTLGIGQVFGPYVTGLLRDATGDYQWSFNAMAIFSALGVVTMLLLKRQMSKTNGEG